MTFSIEYSDHAKKQIKKLNKEIASRIIFALERVRIRPYAFLEKLVESPFYRLRVGDYRVLVDLQREKLLILVVKVGRRREIYKKI